MSNINALAFVASAYYEFQYVEEKFRAPKNIWNCGRDNNTIRPKSLSVKISPIKKKPRQSSITKISQYKTAPYKSNFIPYHIHQLIKNEKINIDKNSTRLIIVHGKCCEVPIAIIEWVKKNHISDEKKEDLYLCWEKLMPLILKN